MKFKPKQISHKKGCTFYTEADKLTIYRYWKLNGCPTQEEVVKALSLKNRKLTAQMVSLSVSLGLRIEKQMAEVS